MVVAVALLAGMDGLGKYLTDFFPVVQVVWARYFFHVLIIVIALVATRAGKATALRTHYPVLQGLRALALLLGTSAMYIGLTRVSLGEATAILFFNPVIVTILSFLFLKERIGPYRVVAVAGGFIGVLFVIQPGFERFDPYLLLPLFSSVMLACFYMLTRRLAGPSEARAALLIAPAGGALVLSLAVLPVWQWPSVAEWLLLVGIGACGACGHFLLQTGFRFGSASALSPFLYTQVLFAALITIFFFGETPNLGTLLGSTLIVGSGILIWFRTRRLLGER